MTYWDENQFFDCGVDDKKAVYETFVTIEKIIELLGSHLLEDNNLSSNFNLSIMGEELLDSIQCNEETIHNISCWFQKVRTVLCMDGINIHRVVKELKKECEK